MVLFKYFMALLIKFMINIKILLYAILIIF